MFRFTCHERLIRGVLCLEHVKSMIPIKFDMFSRSISFTFVQCTSMVENIHVCL